MVVSVRRGVVALFALLAVVSPLALLAIWPPSTAAAATAPTPPSRRVVLVGVPGLRWADLDPARTPNLWRLAEQSAIGSLSVRTIGSVTCTTDGWLTVSAGTRAAFGRSCYLPPVPQRAGAGAVVPGFVDLRRRNVDSGFRADVGLLGETVRRAGGCTYAVGPGAAVAGADYEGRVDRYAPSPAAMSAVDWSRCAVTIVDLDAIARRVGRDRAATTARVDAELGGVMARLPAGTPLLLAGVSDDGNRPRLRVALARGLAGVDAGRYLSSDSTRRPDMVILPDVTATLLRAAGVAVPTQAIGVPWQAGGARPAALAEARRDLEGGDVAAQTIRRLLPWFFLVLVLSQVVLYAAAALALRHRATGAGRRQVLAATRLVALAGAAVPVSAYLVNLVPWWRAGHPAIAVIAGVALADALVVAAALGGPWRRGVLGPGAVVAGVTAAVMMGDLLTGSNLELNSLMGYSPLVGGRYFGMGNIPFAVLAASALLTATALAQRVAHRGPLVAAGVVVALGGLAMVLDGWPAWGSDFGGVIAFVPGIAVTALLAAGRRISLPKLAAFCVIGAVGVLGVAYLDYLRPPDRRTHLGRFFAQLLDGEALPVVMRKFFAMVHTFGNLTLTPIVVAALVFLVFVLRRPEQARAGALELAYRHAPMLRVGLTGVFVTAVVGAAVNDSGVAILALAFAVAVPLALAASVRALEIGEQRSPAPGPPDPMDPATALTSGEQARRP